MFHRFRWTNIGIITKFYICHLDRRPGEFLLGIGTIESPALNGERTASKLLTNTSPPAGRCFGFANATSSNRRAPRSHVRSRSAQIRAACPKARSGSWLRGRHRRVPRQSRVPRILRPPRLLSRGRYCRGCRSEPAATKISAGRPSADLRNDPFQRMFVRTWRP